ncbi:MAG: cysteine desulfurase family protein [Gemmatimonadota bacterium]
MGSTLYLDHAATTPIRPEVREAMAPYLDGRFGNPSSVHRWGREARSALERARERVAAVLGAQPREIVFTGGGTEADNLAVLGRWRAERRASAPGPVVCSAIEHSAVLGATEAAAGEGAEVVVLAVDERGVVDVGEVEEALVAEPAVVSVMWGNNEVGVIQPMARIAERCREAGVALHTDAVQAFGKARVRVDEVACDLLAVSAHKIGGPKGVGALYVRDGIDIEPLVHGGGQERALRPGTQNVAGAVGLAEAAERAVAARESEATKLRSLRDRLEAGLRDRLPGLRTNAGDAERLPHILNVTIPGVDREAVVMALDLEGVAVSSGSACHSGSIEPSHVLMAMGRADDEAATVRFSFGWSTTEEEIERAIERVPSVLDRARAAAR